MLMYGWKNLCQDVKKTIILSNKACARMWNFADKLLEKFDMPLNEDLFQEGPIKLRIA
jgi:hypothetical protein